MIPNISKEAAVEYGRKIRERREKVLIPRSDLARALGMKTPSLVQAEAGNPDIDPRLILYPLLPLNDYARVGGPIRRPSNPDVWTNRQTVAELNDALTRMKPRVLETWLSFKVDGKTVKQISSEMGIGTGLVSARIREAKRTVERYGPQVPANKPYEASNHGPRVGRISKIEREKNKRRSAFAAEIDSYFFRLFEDSRRSKNVQELAAATKLTVEELQAIKSREIPAFILFSRSGFDALNLNLETFVSDLWRIWDKTIGSVSPRTD